MKAHHALPLILLLAACGQEAEPTDTAQDPSVPAVVEEPSISASMPGAGPTSFVGRWAADVAWCPNTNGDTQPITITPTQFIGYENRCDIADVTQTSGAYQATLRCQSEGTTSTERVRMAVQGQNLSLTYVDRDNATVQLTKCTTLADTATTSPVP